MNKKIVFYIIFGFTALFIALFLTLKARVYYDDNLYSTQHELMFCVKVVWKIGPLPVFSKTRAWPGSGCSELKEIGEYSFLEMLDNPQIEFVLTGGMSI